MIVVFLILLTGFVTAVLMTVYLYRINMVSKFRRREIDVIYDKDHPESLFKMYNSRWENLTFDDMLNDWSKWKYEDFFPKIDFDFHEAEFHELTYYIRHRQKMQIKKLGYPTIQLAYDDLTKREKKLFNILKEHFQCTSSFPDSKEYFVTDKIYSRFHYSGYIVTVVV